MICQSRAEALKVAMMPSYSQSPAYGNAAINVPLEIWGRAWGGTPPYTYSLIVGDGTAAASGPVADANFISVTHTYTAAGTKTVSLTVTDSTGATINRSATIRVFVAPVLQEKINMATEKALIYLYKNRRSATADSLYWNSGNDENRVGATGAVLLSFEENGHLPSNDYEQDIYAESVQKGLNWLLTNGFGNYQTLTAHTDGIAMRNEYMAGNGKGAYLSTRSYANALANLAIISATRNKADAQSRIVASGTFAGASYYDLGVDFLDQWSYCQSDGNSRGGWGYNVNTAMDTRALDGSIQQWPILVFAAATDRWGLHPSQWVVDNAVNGYQLLKNTNGAAGYKSNSEWLNAAKSGGLLASFAYAGKHQGDPDVDKAINFIGSVWRNRGVSSNTYEANGGWSGGWYELYSVKKGLQLQGVTTVTTPDGPRNWANDQAAWLLGDATLLPASINPAQRSLAYAFGQNTNGSWTTTGWITAGGTELMTAGALLTLSRSVTEALPVALITQVTDRPPGLEAFEIDGGNSYHQDPDLSIVEYLWDWDASNGINWSAPDASGPRPTHPGYVNTGTYTVTLRVKDNDTPASTNTFSTVITVKDGDVPPVAVAIPANRRPAYAAAIGVPILLDGRESYDPNDDVITLYEWDTDGDGQYDDATGATTTVTFNAETQRAVGLRVTANGKSSTSTALLDLYVSSADLLLTQLTAQVSNGLANAHLVITNNVSSGKAFNGVQVRLYDGDPLGNGSAIGSFKTVDLPSGASVSLDFPNIPVTGLTKLFAYVDSAKAIPENDEINNIRAVDLVAPKMVSNVKAAQIPGTHEVGITYDLASTSDISVQAWIDGSGVELNVPVGAFTGEIGKNKTAGKVKLIKLDAKQSLSLKKKSTTGLRFKIISSGDPGQTAGNVSNHTRLDTEFPAIRDLAEEAHDELTYDKLDIRNQLGVCFSIGPFLDTFLGNEYTFDLLNPSEGQDDWTADNILGGWLFAMNGALDATDLGEDRRYLPMYQELPGNDIIPWRTQDDLIEGPSLRWTSDNDATIAHFNANLNNSAGAVAIFKPFEFPSKLDYAVTEDTDSVKKDTGHELNRKTISNTAEKLVVVVHGWNRKPNTDPYDDDDSWQALLKGLDGEMINYPKWDLYAYRWGNDSYTGNLDGNEGALGAIDYEEENFHKNGGVGVGVENGTQAAEIGYQHGLVLGKLLYDDCIKKGIPLKKVHFIAHSAGTWVARSASLYLKAKMAKNGYAAPTQQITLLDPYNPHAGYENWITQLKWPGGEDSELKTWYINQWAQEVKPVSSENIFSDDKYVSGTNEEYTEDYFENEKIGETNTLAAGESGAGTSWDGHGGPINFYAYTVNTDSDTFWGPDTASLGDKVKNWITNKFSENPGWLRSMFRAELDASTIADFSCSIDGSKPSLQQSVLSGPQYASAAAVTTSPWKRILFDVDSNGWVRAMLLPVDGGAAVLAGPGLPKPDGTFSMTLNNGAVLAGRIDTTTTPHSVSLTIDGVPYGQKTPKIQGSNLMAGCSAKTTSAGNVVFSMILADGVVGMSIMKDESGTGWEASGVGTVDAAGNFTVTGGNGLQVTGMLQPSGGLNAYATVVVPPQVPEILVQDATGTVLVSGAATVECGTVATGASLNLQTLTIKNTGSVALSGLNVSVDGVNRTDFQMAALGTTSLAPGTSVTLNLSFAPTAAGMRTARLRIASNDVNENPFDVNLTGSGTEDSESPNEGYLWTNHAGTPGEEGSADGIGRTARFNLPSGVAVDGAGNVYVADRDNHTIRKMTPDGVVTTLAGIAGRAGRENGTGGAARFYFPTGVAVDGAGNVYVADTENHTIRKVTPAGVVTTLAGTAGEAGSENGTGSAARFYYPSGVTVDGAGNVYVADTYNHTIRKVTPGGVVTTLAGTAGQEGSANGSGLAAQFNSPMGLAVDRAGNVFVADTFNHTIRKVTPNGVVTTLAGSAGEAGNDSGTGAMARFNDPIGIAVDGAGNVYVSDTDEGHTIRKVTPGGVVTTLAGCAGFGGSSDGTGEDAQFYSPTGVAVDGAGNLYIADYFNHTIRKVTQGGVVTTLAGTAGQAGSEDGQGAVRIVQFSNLNGVAVDASGNRYVADTYNHTIRKVTPTGVVTTLAGTAGQEGDENGTGSAARFNHPNGVAVDAAGNVYVADTNNHTIRRVTPSGVVTTLAGTAGQEGSGNGTGSAARFYYPRGVAVDGVGNIYVADTDNHTIRKVTPSGVVTNLVGTAGETGSENGTGSAARFSNPTGVAVDGAGNVYVVDTGNHTIRKVTPSGVATTLAGSAGEWGNDDGTGSAARFSNPTGVAVDVAGNVYVADMENCTIRKVTPSGLVTTLAGTAGEGGIENGTGSAARFYYPRGLAVDGTGNVYVADTGSHTLRKVTAGGVVTTIAGTPDWEGNSDGIGTDREAHFSWPRGVAVDAAGNVYVADMESHIIRKVTPSGVVTTLAGCAWESGSENGTGSAARFNYPSGVAVDGTGNVYVADAENHMIRKVTPSGVVTTLAGTAGEPGSRNGTGSAAQFNYPKGMAVDGVGNVYVADAENHTIRKVTPSGVVTTLAGTAGQSGFRNATGIAAQFSYPTGVAVDRTGNVYVADSWNCMIRKVTAGGVVTTLAGSAGEEGSQDGTGSVARFAYPRGVAVDGAGNVFVADTGNRLVRKVTPGGVVTNITEMIDQDDMLDSVFSEPASIAVSTSGKIYVGDSGNYTIWQGMLLAPEITVEQMAGVSLTDNSGNISHGNVDIGATGASRIFTIRNTGPVDLTGIFIVKDGGHASEFITNTSGMATNLASGASTTFSVTFRPGASGARAAAIHIANNDSDESPFDIAMSGTGVAVPEIAVEQPAGTDLTDDGGGVSFGNVNLRTASPAKTITIRNTGSANLTGIAVTKNGSHGSDFTITTTGMASSLAPGASTTFAVTFAPGSVGARNAAIHIASNDADENPYVIAIAGTGVAVPEIVVEQAVGGSLTDGGAVFSVGNVNLGLVGQAQTFTIRNTGTANLTGLVVTKDGSHGSDFTVVTTGMVNSLTPGASTTFAVTFAPGAVGVRNAAIHIASNDTDENPFDIALVGTGVAVPEIVVEYPEGSNLTDGSGSTIYGEVNLGTTAPTKIFTIRNTGTANLTGIAVTKDGSHSSDFTVITTGMATSVAPGASTTFAVTFAPGSVGARNAAIHITSNDADENPFDIALVGTGVAVPEIAVEQPAGTNLTDGGTSIEFGNVEFGSSGATRMFTIRNPGSANLTGIAVSKDGAGEADFTIDTTNMANTLVPGASTTFAVTFRPGDLSAKSAALHITSNDADENPFDILLTGTGTTTDPFVLCLEGALVSQPRVGNSISLDLKRLANPGETIKLVGKLPTGLKFNALTGMISGIITGKPGTYQLSVQILQGKTVVRTIPFPITVLPYPSSLIGSFESILENDDGIPVGAFKLTITKIGTWSATLDSVGAAKRSAKGTYILDRQNPTASITALFPASGWASAITVSVSLDADSPLFSGTYGGGTVRGFRIATGGELAASSALCNVWLDSNIQDDVTVPAGIGWLKGSIAKTGMGTFKGILGDGTATTISMRLSATGQAVIWAQPYANKNSYIGGITTLPNLGQVSTLDELDDNLWWSKAADSKTLSYPNGFPAMRVYAESHRWTVPATASALGASLGWYNDRSAWVFIDGAGLNNADPQSTTTQLPTEFTIDDKFNLAVSAPVGVSRTPWTGKAVKTDGSFTGTLSIPDGFAVDCPGGAAAVSGVFVQDSAWGSRTGCGLIKVPTYGPKGSFKTSAIILDQ